MKHYDRLKQLLDEELGENNWSISEKPSEHDHIKNFEVESFQHGRMVKMRLVENKAVGKLIEVCKFKYKDIWQPIHLNHYSIKHFWIALLT